MGAFTVVVDLAEFVPVVEPVRGVVKFTPVLPSGYRWTTNGVQIVLPRSVSVDIDSDVGSAEIDVEHPDDWTIKFGWDVEIRTGEQLVLKQPLHVPAPNTTNNLPELLGLPAVVPSGITETMLRGPEGRGVSSIADDDGDGIVTITYSDGETETIPLPIGPTAPPPTVQWDGSILVVGGVPGPDLMGPGTPANQAAVSASQALNSAGIANAAATDAEGARDDAQDALAAVPDAVTGAITAQLLGAVEQALDDAVPPAVTAAVGAQVPDAVGQALVDQVPSAVAGEITAQVPPAVDNTIDAYLPAKVTAALNSSVPGAVSSEVTTQVTPLVTVATTARDEAVSARDATLAAVVITGVGRPDIPATLTTPGTAALVADATSGAVFRSLDGPQGAWEWRKRGATWVCEVGNTGGVNIAPAIVAAGGTVSSARIQRVNSQLIIDVTVLTIAPSTILALPVGWQADIYHVKYATEKHGASPTPPRLQLIGGSSLRVVDGSVVNLTGRIECLAALPWPTTLTLAI